LRPGRLLRTRFVTLIGRPVAGNVLHFNNAGNCLAAASGPRRARPRQRALLHEESEVERFVGTAATKPVPILSR